MGERTRDFVATLLTVILIVGAPIAAPSAVEGSSIPVTALVWTGVPNEIAFADSPFPPYEPGRLQSVTEWGDGVVAVGHDARGAVAWSSHDGVRWTRAADDPAFDGGSFAVVAAAEGHLVAAGTDRMANVVVFTSDDAARWVRRSILPAEIYVPIDLVAGGPGFVLATQRGGEYEIDDMPATPEIWTSADGGSWERATALPSAGSAGDVVAALAVRAGRFVAVGARNERGPLPSVGSSVWISDDGRSWTRAPASPELDAGVMADVVAGPAGFVAVGATTTQSPSGPVPSGVVWTSSDGRTWTRAPASEALAAGGVTAVASGRGGFAALGDGLHGGLAWASRDGVSWSTPPQRLGHDVLDAMPAAIAALGPGFVAVGASMPPVSVAQTNVPAVWLAPAPVLPTIPPAPPMPAVAGHWVKAASLPAARAGSTAVAGSDGTIYFFGGLGLRSGRPAEVASVYAYDPRTGRWVSRRALPAPLVTGSAAVLGRDRRIYVFGEGAVRHPVYAYDPRANRWATVARHGAFGAARASDGRIYALFGGICPFDPRTGRFGACGARDVGAHTLIADATGHLFAITNQRIWRYDPATRRATPLTPLPTPRGPDVAALVDRVGQIWMIGGTFSSHGGPPLVEVYDSRTGRWARGPELPGPVRRSMAAALGGDGRIYALGGYAGDALTKDVNVLVP